MAIVLIEAGRWLPIEPLGLADEFQAKGVFPRDITTLQLLEDLSVAGRIIFIHQERRGDASRGLLHTVAITVIDDSYISALDKMIFEIIYVGNATRVDGVAIVVIDIG